MIGATRLSRAFFALVLKKRRIYDIIMTTNQNLADMEFVCDMSKENLNFEFKQSKNIKIDLSDEDWKQIASEEVIKDMCKRRNSFAYDILLNGTTIGFALCRKYNGGIFLWQYAIASKYQRCGYGKKALEKLIEKINAERNVTYFTTTYTYGNERAKKLYEKLGFKETDIVDEDNIHEVNMELVL